jgi:hypothetical protein
VILSIVTFPIKAPMSVEEAVAIFQTTAPKYRSVEGLLRKNYMVSDDGMTVGAVYLWRSRQDADALYTEDWKKFVTEKYGVAPSLRFMHTPVMVDNVAGEVVVSS